MSPKAKPTGKLIPKDIRTPNYYHAPVQSPLRHAEGGIAFIDTAAGRAQRKEVERLIKVAAAEKTAKETEAAEAARAAKAAKEAKASPAKAGVKAAPSPGQGPIQGSMFISILNRDEKIQLQYVVSEIAQHEAEYGELQKSTFLTHRAMQMTQLFGDEMEVRIGYLFKDTGPRRQTCGMRRLRNSPR